MAHENLLSKLRENEKENEKRQKKHKIYFVRINQLIFTSYLVLFRK